MEQATKLILAFVLAFSTPVWADCPQPVQVIKAGQTANCDGFLFSDKAEQEARQARDGANLDKQLIDRLTQKTSLQDQEINILEKRLNLYITESQQLSERIAKQDNNESIYRFGYFLLGVVVTGLAVRNIRP